MLFKKINFRIILLFIIALPGSLHVYSQDTLTLSGAIQKALNNNYGIIIARRDVDIATLNNNWGTAGRYPSIDFSLNSANHYYFADSTATTNRILADVGLRWTLFDGFRVQITKEQLDKLEDLARGQGAVVIESVIQDVIMGYYLVILRIEQLKVLETVMKLSKDRYRYELEKKELGGSVTYNVLQAKNVFLSDTANFMNQEVNVRNAVRNLNYLMGEEPSLRWNFTDPFEAGSEEYILSDLLGKMKSGNRTLQNQYVNLLLRQSDIKLKQSDLYPSLSLSAGLDDTWLRTKYGNTTGTLLDDPGAYGNLTLSYNIFSGGNRKRAVEIAKISEDIAQTEIEQMEHSLTNQLLNVYDFFEVHKTLLEVANESLEAAELNLQIAGDKYRTGAINSFNYRDIQLIYLNAALRQLEAIYNLIGSHTELTRLTGGFITE